MLKNSWQYHNHMTDRDKSGLLTCIYRHDSHHKGGYSLFTGCKRCLHIRYISRSETPRHTDKNKILKNRFKALMNQKTKMQEDQK